MSCWDYRCTPSCSARHFSFLWTISRLFKLCVCTELTPLTLCGFTLSHWDNDASACFGRSHPQAELTFRWQGMRTRDSRSVWIAQKDPSSNKVKPRRQKRSEMFLIKITRYRWTNFGHMLNHFTLNYFCFQEILKYQNGFNLFMFTLRMHLSSRPLTHHGHFIFCSFIF